MAGNDCTRWLFPKGCCLSFGNFDGWHKGHQQLVRQQKKIAKKQQLTTVLLSYPSQKMGAEIPEKQYLTPEDERRCFLLNSGLDLIVGDNKLYCDKQMDGITFLNEIIHRRFEPRVIVAGDNIRLGNDGCGIEILRSRQKEFSYQLVTVPALAIGRREISTDNIISALAQQRPALANKMLGRTYSFSGRVVHGKGLGRTVAMPTANLAVPSEKLLPAQGVYAVFINLQKRILSGLVNIGLRPSVDNSRLPTVETHIFDFNEDIYGTILQISLLEFIRPVKKFSNLTAVKAQVEKDSAIAMAIFAGSNYPKDRISD